MRIGIDARRYASAGRGPERYVRCLVRAFAESHTQHEFVLLCARGAVPPGALGPGVRVARANRRLRLQYRSRLAGVRRMLLRGLDLVHFPIADGWYARVGRTVVTIHDLSALRYPDAYFGTATAERRARRHFEAVTATADAVISISEATRLDVVDLLGVPEERLATVPLGADPAFRPVRDAATLELVRRRYGLPPRYLLFVGGVDFKKNVGRIIEGFARAKHAGHLPHVLVLAGPLQHAGNPFFDAARQRAQQLGVAGAVRWIGVVPDADLPALYSGADAFVFPSLMEGFGLPVLEAMACGTPPLTSAGSAMAEITGEAGILVDPLSPEAIGEGMIRIVDDTVRRPISEAAMRRAAAYTWERTAARTLEVYERVWAGARTEALA